MEEEREWRLMKGKRKRIPAAEEMAAREMRQPARENEAGSEEAFTDFFQSQTEACQMIYNRGKEVTEGARVASEAAMRGF